MTGLSINVSSTPEFGARAGDYLRHRHGFPEALFQRLASAGVTRPGIALLDLGTGTGSLALGFARQGLEVTGLDRSAAMLGAARARSRSEGLDVHWLEAPAERTGLSGCSFDVITAGQCWHWFHRSAAAAEVQRLLRPEGVLVVAHMDWVGLPGSVLEATLCVVRRHGTFPPQALLGQHATYPLWLDELGASGFEVESFSFDVFLEYDHRSLPGRMRASAALCDLGEERLARFDADYQREVGRRFSEPFSVPHRVYVVLARP